MPTPSLLRIAQATARSNAGDPPRIHDPADVVGSGSHQLGDRDPQVVDRDLRVPVDAGDDLISGSPADGHHGQQSHVAPPDGATYV